MPATETPTLTVIWTARAVARWRNDGTRDPRHTIAAYPVDLSSPWFTDDMSRKFGASWVVIDSHGVALAWS